MNSFKINIMDIDSIHLHCKCCHCKGDLPKSTGCWFIPVTVPWKVPVWGNILTGQHSQGVAYLCDQCSSKMEQFHVKWVVEFSDNDQVVYHEIEWLDSSTARLKNYLTLSEQDEKLDKFQRSLAALCVDTGLSHCIATVVFPSDNNHQKALVLSVDNPAGDSDCRATGDYLRYVILQCVKYATNGEMVSCGGEHIPVVSPPKP